jgi:hypothetical protein
LSTSQPEKDVNGRIVATISFGGEWQPEKCLKNIRCGLWVMPPQAQDEKYEKRSSLGRRGGMTWYRRRFQFDE